MTDRVAPILLGDSLAMRRVRAFIARVAGADLPVLIQGPTGSGKELVAQALHRASARPGRFVPFNVCAVSETMFEDVVFGHVRGAFTGAMSDSAGYLAEADRGTVLLDEIGGLAQSVQPKLLRAIETREFRPVGGRVDRYSDFRLVAATNEDLMRLVGAGRFRTDLAYRLSGIVIEVPSLVERIEDIPLLARHFAAGMSRVLAHEVTLGSDAVDVLVTEPWPGNVRQLRRVVEAAVVLAERSVVGRAEILAALGRGRGSSREGPAAAFRRQRLLDILGQVGWDTAAAARVLGVHRVTVYRRLQRLGVIRPVGDQRDAVAGPDRRHPLAADSQDASPQTGA